MTAAASGDNPPGVYGGGLTPPAFPALAEDIAAEICIIGGGFTGLSAALHLAEAGRRVVLLEAETVGWGASGRNGGQLHTGQRRDQDYLEGLLGRESAHGLWRMAEEAKALVHALIARHGIACDWRPGLLDVVHKRRLVADERAYTAKLRRDYGYDAAAWLDRDELASIIGTDAYFGGRRDIGAGHLDPLALARGLARAATAAGAQIFEHSRAEAVVGSATRGFLVECRSRAPISAGRGGATAAGPRVRADIVVVAGDGYLDGIDADAEARILPIMNYVLATQPIGAGRPGGLIPGGEAISDSRFVVYYWRPDAAGRLIFGGGETYGLRPPADPAALVRRHLAKIYPALGDVAVEAAWGGRVAITWRRLPFIRRQRPGVYVASGYSGQGVALAPYAGKIIADAIGGDATRLDRFAALPSPRFPGGTALRGALLAAGMTWYALRDRL